MADRVQMSCIGKMGRFANSVFQLSFLKIYAKRLGLRPEPTEWVGDELFGTRATTYPPLPKFIETENYDPTKSKVLRKLPRNVDLEGYFQFHTSYFAPDRDYLRSLFQPAPSVLQRLQPAVDKLNSMGQTIVCAHLRRGDYGRWMFYITPVSWYLKKLEEIWPTLPNPVLFVSSENREIVNEFAAYNPQTSDSLGVDLRTEPLKNFNYLRHDLKQRDPHQLDFYPDFYLLSQADVLLMPNSTFSFAAGMLSTRLKQAYRSHLPTQEFRPIDVWDAVPLEIEHQAEQYRHILGVCLDSNPYW